MTSRLSLAVFLTGTALALQAATPLVAPVVAQSALGQLGLTEAQARTFLFEELKSPTDPANRRTPPAHITSASQLPGNGSQRDSSASDQGPPRALGRC